MRELLLDQIVDQRADRGMVETIDDFFKGNSACVNLAEVGNAP